MKIFAIVIFITFCVALSTSQFNGTCSEKIQRYSNKLKIYQREFRGIDDDSKYQDCINKYEKNITNAFMNFKIEMEKNCSQDFDNLFDYFKNVTNEKYNKILRCYYVLNKNTSNIPNCLELVKENINNFKYYKNGVRDKLKNWRDHNYCLNIDYKECEKENDLENEAYEKCSQNQIDIFFYEQKIKVDKCAEKIQNCYEIRNKYCSERIDEELKKLMSYKKDTFNDISDPKYTSCMNQFEKNIIDTYDNFEIEMQKYCFENIEKLQIDGKLKIRIFKQEIEKCYENEKKNKGYKQEKKEKIFDRYISVPWVDEY